jgi:hypothetical protein
MKECNHCLEPLDKVQARLNKLLNRLEQKQRTNPEEVFFDNQQFIQVMNISKRLAQIWRENKVIGYSHVGNKFYYKLSDILSLLEKHYNPAKTQSV